MADVFHIRRAMRHLPGVGPSRMDDFLRRGLHDWGDLLREYRGLGLPGKHARLVETLEAGEAALTRGDIRHFTETLHRADHWRILADFFDRATFLDIETSGDELRPEITTIIAKHAGRLHIFTAERNLDDFLHLLDESRVRRGLDPKKGRVAAAFGAAAKAGKKGPGGLAGVVAALK
ncbi:MAG: hypothetical protein ACO398_10165, partial [Kiritimatiellia bacterium]